MNSELVILGMIYHQPAHGYALKNMVKEFFGDPYFKLNNNTLYSTLKELEENGFITGEEIPGERINKKIYSITEKGRKHLLDLVATPAEPDIDEFDLKVQLIFFDLIPEESRIKVIKPVYEAKLKMYQDALKKKEKYGSDMPTFSFKALEHGIKELKLSLEFYNELMTKTVSMVVVMAVALSWYVDLGGLISLS